MAVAIANAVLMTDGDAAFLRVDNRRPAHALEPGVVARAINCRFDQGKPGPRHGVAIDAWGACGRDVAMGYFAPIGFTFEGTPYSWTANVQCTAGQRYVFLPGNATGILQYTGDTPTSIRWGVHSFIAGGSDSPASATVPTIILVGPDGLATQLCTARLVRTAHTCAYARFSDPTTGTDNTILLTDGWRDAVGEDGGRGHAWRITPGNTPLEINLKGHDLWGTARLVQCDNAMILLRHGNQRYYFSAAAFDDATNDRIQLNVTPPWPLNTGRRVLFHADLTLVPVSAITSNFLSLDSNYFYAKHITGKKIELYTDAAMTAPNKLNYAASPAPVGRFWIEEAIDPEPWFGLGARNLIMQPGPAGETPFDMGFDWILENVAITATDSTTEILTAPNHRLTPGDAVSGTAITGVTWPAYAAPQGEHTLRLYETQEDAMVDGGVGASVAIVSTNNVTDIITATAHGLITTAAVTVTGLTGPTAGVTYYVRNLSANTLTLHPTAAYATANTNIVDLTAVGSETGSLIPLNGLVNLTAGGSETGSLWKSAAASVPLPPCREGAYVNGRFIGINGRDRVVISDPYDFLHCAVFTSTVPANQGEAGQANWIAPLGDNVVVIGKDLNVIGIAGLSGAPSGWSERTITDEYNGLAALGVVSVGTDLWFASRKGLASVIRTVAGESLGVARTLSRDIPQDLLDVDWGNADLMACAVWNNRLFWAVPTKGQTNPTNNKVLVMNFINRDLAVRQGEAGGDIVGGIVASGDEQDAWEGSWTGDLLAPYGFARLKVNGEERLTFATPDGLVCWLHDGWDDAGAEISSELLTRGYFGGRQVLALKGKINWDSFNPEVTASIVSAGVNEEETLAGFDGLTYDRTKYLVDGVADYDPATSTEAQFDAPHRQDYSPTAEELTVARLDVHQNLTEPFRCRTRGTAPQLRITNAQGSLRVCGVSLQAKPAGISATRET